MWELFMNELIVFLVNHTEEIGIGVIAIVSIIALIYIVRQTAERAEAQAKREESFQNRLLDLLGKQTDNNEKLTANDERIVQILEEQDARREEREEDRKQDNIEQRDYRAQQTAAMREIVTTLSLIPDTKANVETIAKTVSSTQASVGAIQSDIGAKAGEILASNEAMQAQLKDSLSEHFKTVGDGITVITEQLTNILKQQADNHTQQQAQDDSVQKELKKVVMSLDGIHTAIKVVHTNLENIAKVPGGNDALAIKPKKDDTPDTEATEDKDVA